MIIDDFVKTVVTIEDIRKDVTGISEKYDLDYYGDTKNPQVKYYTMGSEVIINIIFNMNSIPCDLVRDLDNYMGVACNNISINVAHDLHLRYVLSKRSGRVIYYEE